VSPSLFPRVSLLHFPMQSLFSARLDGDSKWIKPKPRRTVTISFTPQLGGLYEAVLELIFHDRVRKFDFVIERTLCAVASLTSDEGEEPLDSADTGISVSDKDGLDFGIVERTHPDGPFATPTSSLTIENAEGFPAVTLIKARVKKLFGSGSGWVITVAHCCLHSSAAPAS
jgi:hypothetical protein